MTLSGVSERSRVSARQAVLVGLAVGALKAALTLPFIGRYGWHRDELYFLAAAKRPALGYADFPPVTAWIGWFVHALAGKSLVALRLTSLAASIGAIVLVSLMARELGGGRLAQVGAALAFALTPYILAASTIFHTTWFDLLAWTVVVYLAWINPRSRDRRGSNRRGACRGSPGDSPQQARKRRLERSR